ncbi:transcription elongation factor A protein 3 isoform X2 [Amphiprion ocellaris]|uniref:transcription elongation factor A protein 3 isoform X2 n=1 Tax=Amphiprion ocellaris TaxID=80972 RepID=UPI002410E842|nr:transcription elongation factor A protein 3 isoform X2 [Amphiprion ocellaris]
MTREEDLIRIAKKLDKMVSRNNTEGAMDLLKELQGFNMTLKLLQETRIGMSVNGIRKHCTDEEVIALAKVLIKDWKRLLDSGHSNSEKPTEMKNGLDSGKTAASSNSSPSERHSSHRRLDVKPKHDSDPDKTPSDRKEKHNDEHKKRHVDDPRDEKHREDLQNEKHLQEIRKEKPAESPKPETDNKKQKHTQDQQGEKHKSEQRKERPFEEPKKMKHVEELKKEKHPEELKKHNGSGDMKKDKCREESRHERPINTMQRDSEKHTDAHRPIFERRGVLDSSILYPTRFPSPPRHARPPLPIKRPSLDVKKERKDGKDSSSRHPRPPRPSSPQTKRPSVEVKKERKAPPDPNAPITPLPLHLHPPPPRKEPPDPNAPLPPLPLHLHPPPPPTKRPSLDGKKEKDRKASTDSKPPPQKKTSDHIKKDRKDSVDSKVSKKHSDEAKRERKDSSDSKPPPPKKPSLEVKKEKHRKDSSDSKSSQPVKRHSTESKPDRRESTDSKKSSSPPAKKLTAERRESHSSKPPQPRPPQRKPSTDSIDRKGKIEAPKTPTTPTSPMSPSFSSSGGPLSPHLSTGDSVRDKCIEMISAALRTDNDYKDFGANCDGMAVEIEHHIYQETKATDMKYKNRVRSRISNLKDPKNPGLRRNVLAGSIDLHRIATMSAEEMASDELKQLRNVLTQEAIREHQMAKTGGTTTDLLQCSKCKKKNCTYNQVQTRSADEPMTTFVLCNECGNRWKFC